VTKIARPNPPADPAPPGQQWAATVDTHADVLSSYDGGRKCKAQRAGLANPNLCNARAVIVVQTAGDAGPCQRPRREPRCGNHMQGRWVEHGVVFMWQLQQITEEE
jgi:hypothetical protein